MPFVLANNTGAVVSSGGTTTSDISWTVAGVTGFPSSLAAGQYFHVADVNAANASEKVKVTAISGSTWTVVRGDEGTTAVAHTAGFSVAQVVTAGDLGQLAQVANVSAYGAKGDARQVTDGHMATIGSGVLTSAAGLFAAGDVGKFIAVPGAGAGGAPLLTTVASYQSATQVTLTATASTAVSGATVYWGTDDSAAIGNAVTAAGAGRSVYFPPVTYLCNGLVPLNYQTWYGPGATLKWDGAANTSVISSSSGTLTGWTLRDIAVDGGGAANQTTFAPLVQVVAGTHCTAERVAFSNCMGPNNLASGATSALCWVGGVRNTTHSCKFTNVGYAVLIALNHTQSYTTTGNVISDCEVDTWVADAFYLTADIDGAHAALSGSVLNSSVSGCVMRNTGASNNGDGGVEVGIGCVNTSVSDCAVYMSSTQNAGFYVDGAVNTSLSGCTVEGAAVLNKAGIDIFDSNSDHNPTAGVSVTGCTVTNCAQGVSVIGSTDFLGATPAPVTDVTVSGCSLYGGSPSGTQAGINASGMQRFALAGNTVSYFGTQGIQLGIFQTASGACSNGTVTGNTVMSNATSSNGGSGIVLHQACTDVVVSGNRCGDDQGTKTQAYGVSLFTTVTGVTVAGNDLSGNLTGAFQVSGFTPSSANSIAVSGNPGYNPQGSSSVTPGSSPWTYTAGITPEVLYVSGGTVSAVAKNSHTLLTASPAVVALDPNESVTVTYSSAPTVFTDKK